MARKRKKHPNRSNTKRSHGKSKSRARGLKTARTAQRRGKKRHANPRKKTGAFPIVIGWVEEDFKPTGEWRADLGERPKMQAFKVAKVAVWTRSGTKEDLEKANTYAVGQNTKFPYDAPRVALALPAGTKDIIEAAKKLLLSRKNPRKTRSKKSTARKIACHVKATHDLLHGRKAKKCNPHKLSPKAKKFLRRKLGVLVREGRSVKQAVAIAFSLARKRGLHVPALKNPLLGVTSLIGHIPGLVGSNPKKTRRSKSSRKSNPCGQTVRYRSMSKADQKKYRSAAIKAARFAGRSIDDVVFETCETPKGYPKDYAFTEVGERVGQQYRVRGKKSKRHGWLWDHTAGDQGKGKPRAKPPIIAIDPKTNREVLIRQHGSAKRDFSSDRGLIN
jgi:hypothetical protein